MKIRILNLPDAFRLASVLSKYIDVEKLDTQEGMFKFLGDIVKKMSSDEYIHCVMLITNKTEKDIKRENSMAILSAFIRGLTENKIISLLYFYKSVGVKNDVIK